MKLDTILLEQLVQEELELFLNEVAPAVAAAAMGAAMGAVRSSATRAIVPFVGRELTKRLGPSAANKIASQLMKKTPGQLSTWVGKNLKMDLGKLIPRSLIVAYGLDKIFGGGDDGGGKDDDNDDGRKKIPGASSEGDKDKKKAKAAKAKKKSKDDKEELKRYDWWGFQTVEDAIDDLKGGKKKKPAKKKPETPEKD
tara:strand:+ start:160 stop:750 length:591 start_codon:yes stop_codon:yes gene_type:complete